MFSLLKKTITTTATTSSLTTSSDRKPDSVFIADDWEIVDEDRCSFDGDDLVSEPKPLQEVEAKPSPDCKPLFDVQLTRHRLDYGEEDRVDEKEEEEEEDEDDDAYDDEVDEHLVPWEMKGRYGKQRIMKLGKRGQPKFNRANKLPCYYHNRPKGGNQKPVFA